MKFAYYRRNNRNEFVFVPMDDIFSYQDDDGNLIVTPYGIADITSASEVKKVLDEFVEADNDNYVTNKSRVVINGISAWRYRHVHWLHDYDSYEASKKIEDEVLLIPVRDTDEVPKRIIPPLYLIEWENGDKTPVFAFNQEDAVNTYNLDASSIKNAKRIEIPGMSLEEEGLTYNPFSELIPRKVDL